MRLDELTAILFVSDEEYDTGSQEQLYYFAALARVGKRFNESPTCVLFSFIMVILRSVILLLPTQKPPFSPPLLVRQSIFARGLVARRSCSNP